MKYLSAISRRHLVGCWLAVAPLLQGCAQLELTPIKTAQQKPSNVAVYFNVRDTAQEPVSGLTADRFRIYEDGQLLSPAESRQTIVDPQFVAVHYTLLLLDLRGVAAESGNSDAIASGVDGFVERLGRRQKVAVFAFDGGRDLRPVVAFGDAPAATKSRLREIAAARPREASTNLNGAVIDALDALDEAVGRAAQPLKFGTVVVLTDEANPADRVPVQTMIQHVREKPFDVFAIGLGGGVSEQHLREIGKSGIAMALDRGTLEGALRAIEGQIDARNKSYYLLSYCSPSRAGRHEVKIEAAVVDPRARREDTGALHSEFDATGFGPGCDPRQPPNFDVAKGDAVATGEAKTKEDGSGSAEKKRERRTPTRAAWARAPRPFVPPAAPASAPAPAAPAPDFNP